jgi:predicted dehydrogenase
VTTYRAGIIGAGFIAVRGHIPAYQRLPNVRLEAICDVDGQRAASVAAQCGIPRVFTDYRTMLQQADLNLVSVCGPNVLHAPMTIEALEAGCHVICEKPMAVTPAQAEDMVAAAERTGRGLTVGLHLRYEPHTVTLKALAEAGVLGKVYYARATMWRRSGIPGYGSWFTNRDLAGAGTVMDIGVHALDLALHILGFPQPLAVSAITGAYFGPQREGLGWWGSDICEGPARCDVEDNAVAFIRLADGAALTLEVSWASYARPEERYQFLGTEGGADIAPEMYGREQRLRLYRQEHGQAVDIIPELPRYSNSGQDRLIADFLGRLERGEPPLITPRQQLTVVRLLSGILESAATGREVRLDAP